jgi:hypothetical protein
MLKFTSAKNKLFKLKDKKEINTNYDQLYDIKLKFLK